MWKPLSLSLALLLLVAAANRQPDKTIGVENCVSRFRADAREFARHISALKGAIEKIEGADEQSIARAKKELGDTRLAYKRIAFFLEYFFFTSSRIYNRPPKTEIEEPHLEYMDPVGLQYIEALLFDDPAVNKSALLEQCKLLENAADDIPALLYGFKATDGQILESVRLELVRVMTLSITGFDAPLLKSGLDEASVSLQTIRQVLAPYIGRSNDDIVLKYFTSCEAALSKNNDFDHFDRLRFLTTAALPLQEHVGRMIARMGPQINEKGVLNYYAKNLFSEDALNQAAFGRVDTSNKALTDLGEKLFFETKLSANGTRSCASCHNPALHFTDGLPKSTGIHPGQNVRRNAPTLLYAAYQRTQFWDGRAKTLEEQIRTVIHDSLEMNGSPELLVRKLAKNRHYRRLIRKACPDGDSLSDKVIYKSIAAYVRTLQPFNSDFDRYIQGDTSSMTESQVSGFNLFMGKAQCGTCHFAPLFNGLIPPLYTQTEFEILGTTATDDFTAIDSDLGRFETQPTPYYRGAFKTPTVRNAAATAPYMHHGTFGTLEKVVDFYDKGGAAGMGLTSTNQSLSALPLHLSDQEKTDIIAFLHALTDRL
jgi:cytochrome c peroxidase